MLPSVMLMAVAWAAASVVHAKVYERCELARELLSYNAFPASQIATWVCIAEHTSSYDTSAISDNPDGSKSYGMFQINSRYWCGQGASGCGVSCDTLLHNMGEVVKCLKTIHARTAQFNGDGFTAWNTAYQHCRSPASSVENCNLNSVGGSTLGVANAKVYERCELVRELHSRNVFSASQIATWVCIAEKASQYNMGHLKRYSDGSASYGMFLISDRFWCDRGADGCGVECDTLLRNMGELVKCLKTIHTETARISGDGFTAWTDYQHCRNPASVENCNLNSDLNRINEICGRPPSRSRRDEPLVIGGSNAIAGQFPWHAALHYKNDTFESYICGATVVTETALITAAHCVYKEAVVRFTVVLGTLSPNIHDTAGFHTKLTGFAVHHKYDEDDKYRYDIAILYVKQRIPFGHYIIPVCLPRGESYTPLEEKLTVAGWGAGPGMFRSTLASVEMPRVDCPPTGKHENADEKFCLDVAQDGETPVNGDSGGGAHERRNGKWYLTGIVSSRIDKKQIITFTNVYHPGILSWVNQQLAR